MRLYAYAGQSHIKLDVQLQNAALDSQFSGPLYFDSFEISLPGSDTSSAERRAQLTATPLTELVPGALVSGAAGIGIKQFYETWPNGVRRAADGRLVAELFPQWSENQELQGGNHRVDPLGPNGAGVYWFEDMQAVIKEIVLDFGSPSQSQMEGLLAKVQYPPIAVLSLNHHRQSGASLNLGGHIPSKLRRSEDDSARTPRYVYHNSGFRLDQLDDYFLLGWDEFLHSPQRKRAPNTAGGFPKGNAQFFVTGNPRDYFYAADLARGELNVAPQWLPGFSYNDDQTRMQLTENPYGGDSWRKIAQGNGHLRFPYIAGTAQDGRPRDDEHGWFYHVEQSYWFTADPWVRDWYEFVAEFRKIRLNQGDPFPSMQGRAVAHALNHAIQAFRITGDMEIPELFGNYVAAELVPRINEQGAYTNAASANDPGNGSVASWQTGFMLMALIDYLEELPGASPIASHQPTVDFIKRSITWNMEIGNFSNWRDDSLTTAAASDGTGYSLIDPQLWYAQQTGRSDVRAHVETYLQSGINGGAQPYGNFSGWPGTFEGRFIPLEPEGTTGVCR